MTRTETREDASTSTRAPRRRSPPSPAEHLLQMRDRRPDLIETHDCEGVARVASYETLILAATAHFQLIWSRVLTPGRKAAPGATRAADEAWAADTLGKFIDGIYDRLRNLTKEQAQREVGAVATIIAGLKRGQRLCEAMTRERFRERFLQLSKARGAKK